MINKIVPIGLLFLASTIACSSEKPAAGDDVGASAARLVGGVADTADASVVLFEVTGNNGGDCTAEFISTTVLVTAAHCALDEQGKPLSGVQFRIYMGNDYSQVKDADWIYIDPSNVHPNPAYDGDKNDITVLVLSKPMAVTPFAYNTTALTQATVGQAVHLIGYGSNVQGTAASGNNGGFGLKRDLTTTVDDFNADFVHIGATGKNGCDGDSGGPAIVTIGGVPTIIGLDSYSDQQVDCTGGDYYQRVDTQAAFIAQYMTAAVADAGIAIPDDAGTPGSPVGATSSSGSSGTSSSSGDNATNDGTSGTGGTTTTSSTGGCSVARNSRDSSDVPRLTPWLSVLALLALRRRKRRSSV
jgi:hypothetical protein